MYPAPTDIESVASRSWWLREAVADEVDAPVLEGDLRADVCIVGGGYAGLWTALRIKEQDPSVEVVLVEAEVCGSGASGRNGGFALTMWHHFHNLERVCGTDEAVRLGRASEDAVDEIGRFCREHGVDADYRRDGWLWTATNASQVGAWDSTIAELERHGVEPFERWPVEQIQRRSGSDAHLAGVFEPCAATVQPARLARGLRRVAMERGVRIFERSPMVGLGRSAVLEVRTPRGRVRAGRVVLAMNAWSARIRELRNAFVVVSSDLLITEPAPEVLEEIGWRDGMAISDSRLLVHYYRTTPAGRVAFGRGGARLAYGARLARRFHGEPPDTEFVSSSLHRLYPALESVPIASAWTGPIDRPLDGLPFFSTLGRPDLIVGAGFAGNGVAPTVTAGRILASMALGIDDEWSGCGLVRAVPGGLPPDPLRYVGGRIVQSAVARKERAEDGGRKPARIDRALTALAPSGLVPTD